MPKSLGIIYLESGDVEAQANQWQDMDVLLAWDREADVIGAPQNVEALHRLVGSGRTVWYRGGLETVHTAELILGLGCEKVIVSKGFFRTDLMPQHFVRRLGQACVPLMVTHEELDIAIAAGAAWAYCINTGIAEVAATQINVIVEGASVHNAWGTAFLPGAEALDRI